MKRVHLVIRGRVQGVYYRQSLKDAADAAGVTGWVRNLVAGQVEAVLEGDDDAIDVVLSWSRRGPERAYVERVDLEEFEPTGEFPDFTVRR